MPVPDRVEAYFACAAIAPCNLSDISTRACSTTTAMSMVLKAAGNPDPGDDINIIPVAEPVPQVEARPQRERRPPERHGNNIYDG